MALAQSLKDCGSDEVRDTVVDICAYCATRDKLQPASHFCCNCGVFGRYICGICLQHHNLFTDNHDVKRISGKGLDKRKQLQNEIDELRRSNSDKDKQLAERNKQLKLIERECTELKTRDNYMREELQIKMSMVTSLEDEIKKLAKGKRGETTKNQGNLKEKYEEEIKNAKSKIQTLSSNLNHLETRLQGIWDIVCLFNRIDPKRIAEQYCELYDNNWTNAFEVLEKKYSEEESIAILLSGLQDVSEICGRWARAQKKRFQEILSPLSKTKSVALKWPWKQDTMACAFRFEENSGLEQQKLLQLLLFAEGRVTRSDLVKTCWADIRTPAIKAAKLKQDHAVIEYVADCVDVCLRMSIHEPPLVFGRIPKKMEKFDNTVYKYYTRTGPFYDFLVWSPIYLQENGSILCKGVAEGVRK